MTSVVDVCAAGIWIQMYDSYPESVFLTQWDQSQHLKQSKWAKANVSSHSTTLYYFVLRTNTVLCSWRLVPPRLPLLCTTCQHLGVDHRTVPAKTLGRHAVMLTGLLLPWSILFVQRHNVNRTSMHSECFAVCWNFCSTRKLQERDCSWSARE